MSHATLMVKVTAKRLHKMGNGGSTMAALDAAISDMMEPYNEQTEDPRYRVFEDAEPECRPQYENESTERVQTPDGALLWPWDDRFQIPGRFRIGGDTHHVPYYAALVSTPEGARAMGERIGPRS